MRFRLVCYNTKMDDRREANNAYEYLGDAESIFFLWHTLSKDMPHVEVFNLAGHKLDPRNGIYAMVDCC